MEELDYKKGHERSMNNRIVISELLIVKIFYCIVIDMSAICSIILDNKKETVTDCLLITSHLLATHTYSTGNVCIHRLSYLNGTDVEQSLIIGCSCNYTSTTSGVIITNRYPLHVVM